MLFIKERALVPVERNPRKFPTEKFIILNYGDLVHFTFRDRKVEFYYYGVGTITT